MQHGYNINELFSEAQSRWLKPAEVLYILQNHEQSQFYNEPPNNPTSGSLYLFNRRVLRFFRKDGYNWRKKKDGRNVGEAHERLKVGNVETLNCYYAHGEDNPNFQRRSFWMLDPAYDHIVLVHYRDTKGEKTNSGSVAQLSSGSSSSFNPSPTSYVNQNPGSTFMLSDLCEPYQNFASLESVEITSNVAISNCGTDNLDDMDGTVGSIMSCDAEVSQALRRLEEQLSLNEDNIKEIPPFSDDYENSNEINLYENRRDILRQENGVDLYGLDVHNHTHNIFNSTQGYIEQSNYIGVNGKGMSWNEVMDSCQASLVMECPGEQEISISAVRGDQSSNDWLSFHQSDVNNSSLCSCQQVNAIDLPSNKSMMVSQEANSDYCKLLFDQDRFGMPLERVSSLTIAQKQKFTIKEISPEWGYATEATKVIIVGSFLCDSSESSWKCMFGDVEVPVNIVQGGALRCEAPPHLAGKVTLCITSGNRESCSEVREFEYRTKTSSCPRCDLSQLEAPRSLEELLLLVRIVQLLLSDSSSKNESSESDIPLLRRLKADDESWSHTIDALLFGSGTSSATVDWLLEQLLKDKLFHWLSCRSQQSSEQTGCSFSKKEQGLMHMVAGLGFEWALNPILSCGVNINFRDINGWTALHWAARFGREKMVAALIASGASAGAVTDPCAQDPTGKKAASIAASCGHKGLAGYLSEVALTTHLSSLTLEESEHSKGSAEVEAELTINKISEKNFIANDDQLSLKHTLTAVRNSAQAAAHIQSAFRAHSFRKRRQKEAAATGYGITSGGLDDFPELSVLSKLTFPNSRGYNSAALSIQKKYRGWKGRKDFLALRQEVVKIQAHVRGYQVRKQYKAICWTVGIFDKVILRWRRKGVGLRGFRRDSDIIAEDKDEDEDILKVFRKQKVDGAVDEAVSQVLSMVESPEARQQYQRMLEKYHQAKAEMGSTSNEATSSTPFGGSSSMMDDDLCQLP